MASEILDFTDVKERSQYQPRHVPEDDYTARIVSVETTTSKSDNEKMWVFGVKLDDRPSGTYPYYCKLTPEQLWKVRNILVAAGISVPKRKMKIDPQKAVGKALGVSMLDDEYEGRMKSVIDSVFPVTDAQEADDDEDDDEPEEKPVAKKSKKKAAPEPEPEDDEDDEDEDEDDDEEPEPPKKTAKKGAKKAAPAKKAKAKPAPVEDDDDDEDDDLELDEDDL